MCKISVIMPVYNSGKYLKTAIDSILNQSFKDFELIIVDDGSNDGTSEKCDEYAKNDKRVIVIHQKNGGICNARNVALEIACGEYVAFSDHDDEYLPGLLEEAYRRAINDNSDIVKFCKEEIIINNDRFVKIRTTTLDNKKYDKNGIKQNYFKFLNGRVLECVWDGLFRRDLFIRNGILFDEYFKYGGEDIDILLKLIQKANVFSCIGKIFYRHFVRTGFSTSQKYNPHKIDNCKYLAKEITEVCEKMNIINTNKCDYVHQITYTYICDITAQLAKSTCMMSRKEKVNTLRILRDEIFLPKWFFSIRSISVMCVSFKVGLCYFLYKYGFYNLLLKLYEFRNFQIKHTANLLEYKKSNVKI